MGRQAWGQLSRQNRVPVVAD
eukprot:SAG31_NODE_45353_length_259_cov_0.650000_1_plen_20_part_10